MEALLGLVLLGLIVLAIIGAIKPDLVLPRALNPTKGKALSIYLGTLFVIGMIVSSREKAAEEERMKDPAYAAAKKAAAAEAARRDAESKRAEEERKRLEGWESTSGKISANGMCKEFVLKRLKAPATAEFASFSESKVTHLGEGEFLITSHVDAQNSFGAKLRNRYTCRVKDMGNDNWRLLDLNMK